MRRRSAIRTEGHDLAAFGLWGRSFSLSGTSGSALRSCCERSASSGDCCLYGAAGEDAIDQNDDSLPIALVELLQALKLVEETHVVDREK